MELRDLKRGDRFIYKGFETTPSLEILHVMVPGHPEYDGALPGIAYRWLKRRGNRSRWFYPCHTVEQFFAVDIFANLERVPKQ